jgi:hypothetical protein
MPIERVGVSELAHDLIHVDMNFSRWPLGTYPTRMSGQSKQPLALFYNPDDDLVRMETTLYEMVRGKTRKICAIRDSILPSR